jgi:hypothetical protein
MKQKTNIMMLKARKETLSHLNKKGMLIICSEWSYYSSSMIFALKNYFLVMGWTGFVLWKAFYQ